MLRRNWKNLLITCATPSCLPAYYSCAQDYEHPTYPGHKKLTCLWHQPMQKKWRISGWCLTCIICQQGVHNPDFLLHFNGWWNKKGIANIPWSSRYFAQGLSIFSRTWKLQIILMCIFNCCHTITCPEETAKSCTVLCKHNHLKQSKCITQYDATWKACVKIQWPCQWWIAAKPLSTQRKITVFPMCGRPIGIKQ